MVIASIISWLESLVTNLVCFIITALVRTLNFVIAALGLLVEGLLALLPDMPTLPARPSEFDTALGWINWFFPVGAALGLLTFMVTAWLLWQAVAVGLRWAKAIDQ